MNEAGDSIIVRQPVRANMKDPLRCRRAVSPVGEERAPDCDGILEACSSAALSFPIVVACQKCGLHHAFVVIEKEIFYGAVL